jgi:hypothetical protein
MTDNLGETIDNYRVQLGKYNQVSGVLDAVVDLVERG